MKIAVPYDRGKIDPHFGHSQYFEIYTIENKEIIGKMNIPSKGSGHEHMIGLMKRMKVNAVIAGNMGKKAILGLKEANITTYIGLSGSVEDAILRYIDGELENFNAKNLDLSLMEDECSCH